MTKRAPVVYLGVLATAAGAYFAVPTSTLRAICWSMVGLTAVGGILVGIRTHAPRRALPWYLLAAGQLAFITGDSINYTYEWVLHREVPFPSVADVIYLAMYPLVGAGLLLLIRHRKPGRDWPGLIDATIITVGVGLFSWVFLIDPYVRDPSLTLVQKLVAVAYPLGDLFLLAVAVRLWDVVGRRTAASMLLIVGLVALLVGDTLYGALQLSSGWTPGSWLDAIWLPLYAGLGLAALHPSMRTLSEPTSQVDVRLTPARLGFLGAATLAEPALLAIQGIRHQPIDVALIAVAGTVLFLLALTRIALLAGQVVRQEERRRALSRVLRAAQDERMRLAADLHDGPVQTLTAVGYGLARIQRRLDRQGDQEMAGMVGAQQSMVSDEVGALRTMLAELRPPALDEQGLAGALKTYGDVFSRQAGVHVTIDAQVEDGQRPSPEVETIVYRIVQEALANVAKHAQARHARIALTVGADAVELHVSDDGVGFDPDAAARAADDGSHFGLIGMRERVEMSGGRWELRSSPGAGTSIHVVLNGQLDPRELTSNDAVSTGDRRGTGGA